MIYITIKLNKLKRKIYINFKDSNYKYIDRYIENETNIDIIEYIILKRKFDSIILRIKEIIKIKKNLMIKNIKKNLKMIN